MLNLAEYTFRDVKSIERSVCVYGELNGLLSLGDSAEAVANKNYSATLKEMGYIR